MVLSVPTWILKSGSWSVGLLNLRSLLPMSEYSQNEVYISLLAIIECALLTRFLLWFSSHYIHTLLCILRMDCYSIFNRSIYSFMGRFQICKWQAAEVEKVKYIEVGHKFILSLLRESLYIYLFEFCQL